MPWNVQMYVGGNKCKVCELSSCNARAAAPCRCVLVCVSCAMCCVLLTRLMVQVYTLPLHDCETLTELKRSRVCIFVCVCVCIYLCVRLCVCLCLNIR